MDEAELARHIDAVTALTENTTNDADDDSTSHLADPMLQMLCQAGADDPEYVHLIDVIKNGFPSSSEQLEPPVRHFWKLRSELWTEDRLVLYRSRIVIPRSQCTDILARLQDIERTKRRQLLDRRFTGRESRCH